MAKRYQVLVETNDGKKKSFPLEANSIEEAWEEAKANMEEKGKVIDVKEIGPVFPSNSDSNS